MRLLKRCLYIGLLASLLASLSVSAMAHSKNWYYRDKNIRVFRHYDYDAWRHGYWYHGWRNGRYAWWWYGGGIWYPYPRPIYPYPNPYIPPTIIVTQPPPVQSAPPPSQV